MNLQYDSIESGIYSENLVKIIYIYIALILSAALFMPLPFMAVALVFTIIPLMIYQPEVLKAVRSKLFWIFLVFLTLVQPMIFGVKDVKIYGIPFSTATFYSGLQISLRAILVMLAFSIFMKNSRDYDIFKLWQKLGIKDFDRVYSEAQNLMPAVKENIVRSGKLSRKQLFNPVEFASNLLAGILGKAEETSRKED